MWIAGCDHVTLASKSPLAWVFASPQDWYFNVQVFFYHFGYECGTGVNIVIKMRVTGYSVVTVTVTMKY